MAEVPGVGAIVEQIKARIAQIEQQLRQHRDLSDELERLRDALGRLERGVGARVRGRRAPDNAQTRPTAGAAKRNATAKGAAASGARRRSGAAAPRGQTRAKVLEALKDGPKTAGDIATMTGVPRGSASTTLSKLAKSGEVVKAERGYKLPE
jgi:CRP-like cAMP-binding protein